MVKNMNRSTGFGQVRVKGKAQSGYATRAGVMLADILVAVILLGSALAVMVGMAGRAISAQHAGEISQVVAMLLDEQLNLVLARGPDKYAARFAIEGACDAPFESYKYKLDITGGDAGAAYVVIATIRWNSGGKAISESVETRIAPRRGDDNDPDRRPETTVDRLQ